MDKQVAIRRVRIAVSVFFGVLTVALCVLWVRSYTWRDRGTIPFSSDRTLRIDSDHGTLQFETYGKSIGEDYYSLTAVLHSELSAARKRDFPFRSERKERAQWRWETSRTGRFFIYVPHWFAAALAIVFAIFATGATAVRTIASPSAPCSSPRHWWPSCWGWASGW